MATRLVPALAALAVATIGGAFFGLASCGGYAWHRPAFNLLEGALLVAAIVFPIAPHFPRASRVGVVLGACILFVVVQAAAWAYYIHSPGGTPSYWSELWGALRVQYLWSSPC